MYVVAGVTGHTGKVTAEQLLAQGHKVRVIVRDAAKGAAFAARGAEVAVADLGDAKALAEALRGADGAYLLVPPNLAAPDFRAYQRATVQAIAEAVDAARVPHVVFLSSIGAGLPSGTGPIAALHEAEQSLGAVAAKNGTHATFIRAGYFVENVGGSLGALAAGILPSFFPADLGVTMIATADIGRLAATLLVEGGHGTTTVELGGPDVSMNDIADAIARVDPAKRARPTVAVQPVAGMAEALQGFGLPAGVAALYQEMTEAIIAGKIRQEPGLRTFPRRTPIDDVLRGLLA